SQETPNTSEAILTKLVNDVLALKKQVAQSSKPTPYKDISRKGYAPNKYRIAGAPTRLAIEAAPVTNSKCDVIEESNDEIKVVEVGEEEPDSETSKPEFEDLGG
ncbi:hypothetical protein KI387_017377, partial [Taxus chinensis]